MQWLGGCFVKVLWELKAALKMKGSRELSFFSTFFFGMAKWVKTHFRYHFGDDYHATAAILKA